MTLSIGNVTLDNDIIVGPMAGISNLGFREVIREFGPGLVCSEMLSDKAIVYHSRKTIMMTAVGTDEGRLSFQLFGHEMESMCEAARFLDKETGCDIIDINMGCPVPKVVNNHAGSALMRDVGYAEELVRAIINAVDKPVTVKMRSGWDAEHINAVELAQAMERAGASAVCVHPRTHTEYYSGHSNWDIIRQVKEKLNIPVIGNGDIKTVEDKVEMARQTGCDGFMISRGCLGNPWLISQLVHYEQYGEILPEPSPEDKLQQCLAHAESLVALKGEKTAIKEMRGHACWYINGLPCNNRVKAKINDTVTLQQLTEIMNSYGEAMKNNDYSYFE